MRRAAPRAIFTNLNKGEKLRRLSRSPHRKTMSSADKQADVATQQADEVISAKEKGAGDAKTEKSPQKRSSAEVSERRVLTGAVLMSVEQAATARRCSLAGI